MPLVVLNYSYIISNVYALDLIILLNGIWCMLTIVDIGVKASTWCQYVWFMVLFRLNNPNTLNTRTLGYDYNYKTYIRHKQEDVAMMLENGFGPRSYWCSRIAAASSSIKIQFQMSTCLFIEEIFVNINKTRWYVASWCNLINNYFKNTLRVVPQTNFRLQTRYKKYYI